MNIKHTYRAIAATFFIVAITQVFVLQSVHHVCEHHDEEETCNSTGAHFHSIEQSHFACDICFFQLSPTETSVDELSIQAPKPLKTISSFVVSQDLIATSSLQEHLRGPPAFLYI